MTLKKDLLNTLKILIVATILSFGISVAYAQWAAPTSAPPAGNVSTPINTSTTAQIKTGALGVAAFTADSALFDGDVTATGNVTVSGSVTANDVSAVSGAFSGNMGVTGNITANNVSASSGTFSGNVTADSVVLSGVTKNSWSGMVIGGGVDEDTDGYSCKSWGTAKCGYIGGGDGVICPAGSTKRVLALGNGKPDGPGFFETLPSLCVIN